jgi:hypothetical protein
MKRPWQIGLLIVAIIGVSVYNLVFFKNYLKKDSVPTVQQPEPEYAEEESPVSVAPDSYKAEPVPISLSPIISLKDLDIFAKQAYTPESELPFNDTSEWPERDPLKKLPHEIGKRMQVKRTVSAVEPPIKPSSLQEPHCTFSGTLINTRRRIALIDGESRSIGDLLNGWRLAGIERDYILLEAGNEIRRIELNGASVELGSKEESL